MHCNMSLPLFTLLIPVQKMSSHPEAVLQATLSATFPASASLSSPGGWLVIASQAEPLCLYPKEAKEVQSAREFLGLMNVCVARPRG